MRTEHSGFTSIHSTGSEILAFFYISKDLIKKKKRLYADNIPSNKEYAAGTVARPKSARIVQLNGRAKDEH